MFAYDFMRYAFVDSTFIAITSGMMGGFIVESNQAGCYSGGRSDQIGDAGYRATSG